MLAAPKKKTKYSLNPRGNDWVNGETVKLIEHDITVMGTDESKFGQKLLEKMGWSKGKGLGKREDGPTEHIRIAHKTDAEGKSLRTIGRSLLTIKYLGLGYKEKDNVQEFSAEYDQLLANLNSHHKTGATEGQF